METTKTWRFNDKTGTVMKSHNFSCNLSHNIPITLLPTVNKMNAPTSTTVLPYNEMQEYALQFFHEHINEKLVYHDLVHTQDVVSAVTQIANHYHLNDNDFFIVLTAAWFHDTGHFIDSN